MTLKQPIEVRSVRTGRFTVQTALASDVATADFCSFPRPVHVVNNVAKALTIGNQGVDIRSINRALREPQEPMPQVTSIDALSSTR
jgi:hypothetical protein